MTKTMSTTSAAIKVYVDELGRQYATGNATEHSYRPALKDFVAELLPQLTVVNEPKRIACGAPDYILQRDTLPVAFIEAKDIGDSDLDGKKQNREQFDRYKKSLNNLIFTDYLVFHFYQNGEFVEKVMLAEVHGKKIVVVKDNIEKFVSLVEKFGNAEPQAINSAKELATIMAGKARLLASAIEKTLAENKASSLSKQMAAFRKVLIHDLEAPMFADVYAQTVVYGMFAARLHTTNTSTFSRDEAAKLIPKTNPFLRTFFNYIAGINLDERIAWIVDDLVAAFKVTDVDEVMAGYGKRTSQTDPFLHFYENFLAAYNPELRKERGVWYTPPAIVGYIVRAVDDILQRDFGLKDGLANAAKVKKLVGVPDANSPQETREFHKVHILDPGTGTGTFLAEVVQTIHAKMSRQKGAWQNYVTEHLLPRLHGFEILMAPYAMAHLKLEMLLAETGYRAETDQRLGIYLTNSLEESHEEIGEMFYQELADEANAASGIKRDAPVMVVLGNPPYNAISANKGKWMDSLIEHYKYVNGVHFGERKHWLQDDYVKFIRLGQEFVDRNASGVLAYINNNGFLDNPTFRGMRWNLLKSFDKIYVVNLHGSSKKKESAPDGGKDENVFDIQQGVSINIFIKTGKKKAGELAEVFHCNIFGKRADKYTFLVDNNLKSTQFAKIVPNDPSYFFVPKSDTHRIEYESGFGVNELFAVNTTGIVTMGDTFAIADTKLDLKKRLEHFAKSEFTASSLTERYDLGKNYAEFVLLSQKSLTLKDADFVELTYRPFDTKWTYFSNKIVWRPRTKIMRHLLAGENVGLVAERIMANKDNPYRDCFVTSCCIDCHLTGSASYVFPLYLYPESGSHLGETSATPNLKPEIVNAVSEKLGIPFDDKSAVLATSQRSKKSFTPLDLFDYIYGVLHSPNYRERYSEFLKTDFPRVPYPQDAAEFWRFAKFGGELRRVHLLEHESLDALDTSYNIAGDNVVTNVKYVGGKVYISATQYFGDVKQIAWEFYIGGYQPAQKWLKDRKNQTLSHSDIMHYQRILAALSLTAELMREIDEECIKSL